MNKKLLIVIVLIVLVAAVWWWKTQAPSYEAPASGTAAPASGGAVEPDNAAAINQELDALDLGEFDADFEAIDAELNSL